MKKLRVLVVDDDPTNVEVVKVILANADHEVTVAEDGSEAIARCLERQEPFDLVLMDCYMPKLDGLATIRTLRARTEWQGVPIIMVTGSTAGVDRASALAAGADRVFNKPFRRQQLLDTIELVLQNRALMQAAASA